MVYHTLARRMSAEHRFAACAKLVAEVLGGVVDGMLPLGECSEVLGDALRLLGSKEMKVGAGRAGQGGKGRRVRAVWAGIPAHSTVALLLGEGQAQRAVRPLSGGGGVSAAASSCAWQPPAARVR